MGENKTTSVITISIDREIYNNIDTVVNNKSKFTEWLFIKYLEKKGIDVKIKF